MKKINSSIVSVAMLLFFVLSVQSVFAVDVPLKNGDTGTSGIGGTTTIRSRTITIIPVTVNFEENLLAIYFNSEVGVATVSITDEYGNVVYDDAIDTEFDSEMYIPTDDFDGGTYTITITYSTKTLTGEFQL